MEETFTMDKPKVEKLNKMIQIADVVFTDGNTKDNPTPPSLQAAHSTIKVSLIAWLNGYEEGNTWNPEPHKEYLTWLMHSWDELTEFATAVKVRKLLETLIKGK